MRSLKTSIIFSLAFSFFISYSNYVKAEEQAKDIKEVKTVNLLTLSEAIDIAVQNSYALKSSSEKINFARYQVTESAAQDLPQITINTSYGRQDPVSSTGTSSAGGLGNSPQFASLLGTSRVNSFSNNVSVNQILFAGFRILDGIKLANVNVDLSQESLRQARQDLVNSVSTAYFNALKALQLVQINKTALKNAEQHLDYAKKLEKAGVGIKFDVIRSNNQLVNTQMQLSQALNSLEKAKKALNLAIGRSIDFPFELNTEAKIPNFELDENKLLKQALENRSELKQLKIKKTFDEITTTIQSRSNWPTISASASYNISDSAVVNANSTNNQNIKYGINMNWPVFDGLLTYAKVQKAQNSVIQDQISIDQLQQSIILEVRQIFLDIKEASERLILAKSGVSLAEESLRLAQIRYENGVGISLDVLDAQNSLTQAKANMINSEFDLNISKIKLYRSLGIDI